MKKRVVAVLLCLMMVLSLLAGCGQKKEAQESSGSVTKKTETSGSAAEKTSENSNEAEEKKELVELRLVVFKTPNDRANEFLENEFHDKVLEELNIDLTVELHPWSDQSAMRTALAGGERMAIMDSLHSDGISKGYYTPIDEAMIQELMPDYLEMRGDNGFDFCKANGEIYLLPMGNKAYAGRSQFILARNDILKEVGWDAADITTYDQLMEAIADVREKYPDMGTITNPHVLWSMINDEISDQYLSTIQVLDQYVYVDESTDDDKVYSKFESEAFRNLCEITAQWYEKGYITDRYVSEPSHRSLGWSMGTFLFTDGFPNSLMELNPVLTNVPDAELALIYLSDRPLLKKADYDQGLLISAADADNIDRWLELVNWIYKDKENYTFAFAGIEGKDYEITEEGRMTTLTTQMLPGWWLEATSLHTYGEYVTDEALEQYAQNDVGSQPSKAAGFAFDSTPVSSEAALLKAVYDEWVLPMIFGVVNYEENYDDVIKRLKDAGIDAYVAEYQKQFSAWHNAK